MATERQMLAIELVKEELTASDKALLSAMEHSAQLIQTGIAECANADIHMLAVADALAAECETLAALGVALRHRKAVHERLHGVMARLGIVEQKASGDGK